MIGAMVVGRVWRVAAVATGPLAAYMAWNLGVDYRASILAGCAVAALAWFIDNRLHVVVPLSPFIVTLGMWGALRGAAKGLAGNSAVYVPATRLNEFMKLPLPKSDWSLLARPWQWWSPGVWVFLGLAVLIAAVLRYTQFGRHIYAIGSNEQTARLCGIQVERTKLKIYSFALLLTGVAGVMQFSFVTVGDPTTAFGYELRVIAAVVIGGASLSGGMGGVLGALAGALLISIIDNGCTMLEYEVWVQEIVTGGIIVAAVTMDKLRAQRAAF
ncbi:MAG: ABC transporter permease [Planctomycetota bacterium]|nr:MAG: ABC transporter permease [Planctomycetota bacterium]